MAKTESTAVNELIDLVQNKPLTMEPADDLFSAPKSIQPARMTAPVPAMRGAGEVAPLPRAARHTARPRSGSRLRMATRDAIPPIAIPPPHGVAVVPPPHPPASDVRARRRCRPAPDRARRCRRSLPSESRCRARLEVELAAAARHAALDAATGDHADRRAVRARGDAQAFSDDDAVPITADTDDWFEASIPRTAKHEATVQVASARDTIALVKKLIVPTIILTIIGVMIGLHFAPDRHGGKKTATPSAPAVAVAAAQPADTEQPAARPPIAPSENAGTASVGGNQPEPPTKAEVRRRPRSLPKPRRSSRRANPWQRLLRRPLPSSRRLLLPSSRPLCRKARRTPRPIPVPRRFAR